MDMTFTITGKKQKNKKMKTTKNSSDPSEGNTAVSEISQQEKTVADSTDAAETFDLSLPLKKKRKGKIKVLHRINQNTY